MSEYTDAMSLTSLCEQGHVNVSIIKVFTRLKKIQEQRDGTQINIMTWLFASANNNNTVSITTGMDGEEDRGQPVRPLKHDR